MRSNKTQCVSTCVVLGLIALVLPAPVVGQPRPAIQWGVDFSSDGSFIATCGDRVRVYEVKTGKRLREIEAGRFTRSVAFSPVDPKLFAAAGDDSILRLWRIGKEDFVQELKGHAGMIASVAFEKSGQYVASGSVHYEKGKRNLGQFRLWEIETGKLVQSHEIMEGGIQGVSFSDDGKRVAFCCNLEGGRNRVDVYRIPMWKRITSVELSADKELETTKHGKALPFGTATRFERDHKHLLVAGGICVRVDPGPYTYACQPTGLLWRADLAEPSSAKSLVEPSRGYYRSLGLAPDGKLFATGNGALIKDQKPLIQMRDVTSGKLLWSVVSSVEPYGVAMSPDGRLVAACQRDGVHLLNARTGERVRVIAPGK